MFVVGATQGSLFADIRKLAPNSFLLVPGVGAQGGSLQEVCKYGMNKDCGLLVKLFKRHYFMQVQMKTLPKLQERRQKNYSKKWQ